MAQETRSLWQMRMQRWTARLSRWSRWLRVTLSLIITLELTVFVGLLVDSIVVGDALSQDVGARTTALVIIAVVGVVIYAVGWWALVGFDFDPDHPWQANAASVLFVLAGLIAFFVLAVLVVAGLLFGTQ